MIELEKKISSIKSCNYNKIMPAGPFKLRKISAGIWRSCINLLTIWMVNDLDRLTSVQSKMGCFSQLCTYSLYLNGGKVFDFNG